MSDSTTVKLHQPTWDGPDEELSGQTPTSSMFLDIKVEFALISLLLQGPQGGGGSEGVVGGTQVRGVTRETREEVKLVHKKKDSLRWRGRSSTGCCLYTVMILSGQSDY